MFKKLKNPALAGRRSLFKGKVLMVLVVMLLCISFAPNLQALISSRIEGVVYDKKTGKPIEGAEVIVCSGDMNTREVYCSPFYEYTDSKGYFEVNVNVNNTGRKFFVLVFKKGYASYGHIIDKEQAIEKGDLNPSAGQFNIMGPTDRSKWFGLKEGEIKHLKIGMEKEAIVDINISYKYPPEIKPMKPIPDTEEYTHDIVVSMSGYEQELKYSAWKNLEIRGLASGEVSIEIYTYLIGYPRVVYKRKLKSGERVVINHVFDLTKGGVIYGKLYGGYRTNSVIISNVSKDKNASIYLNGYPNHFDRYLIGGLPKGKYEIECESDYAGRRYKKYIYLKEGEIKRLDIRD